MGSAAALIPFVTDPEVSDLLINGTQSLYVERRGLLETHPNPFRKTEELTALIERFVVPLVNESTPRNLISMDACTTGVRFHVMLSPIALCGPLISIRSFPIKPRTSRTLRARPVNRLAARRRGRSSEYSRRRWNGRRKNFVVESLA